MGFPSLSWRMRIKNSKKFSTTSGAMSGSMQRSQEMVSATYLPVQFTIGRYIFQFALYYLLTKLDSRYCQSLLDETTVSEEINYNTPLELAVHAIKQFWPRWLSDSIEDQY